jgi:hypothetical protein
MQGRSVLEISKRQVYDAETRCCSGKNDHAIFRAASGYADFEVDNGGGMSAINIKLMTGQEMDDAAPF